MEEHGRQCTLNKDSQKKGKQIIKRKGYWGELEENQVFVGDKEISDLHSENS